MFSRNYELASARSTSRSSLGDSGERPSARALARNFQRIRGPVPPPPEPMVVEEAPLEQPPQARRSRRERKPKEEKAQKEGLGRVRRSKHSSHEEKTTDSAKTSRVTGRVKGKKPASEEFSRERQDVARGKRLEEGGASETEDSADNEQPEKGSLEDKYLSILLAMGFAGTRYPHRETCTQLGIAKDVEFLYRVSGLGKFMSINLEAYREETCHLLSSLSLHLYENEPDYESDGGPGFITFKCRGILYSLTIKELEVLFDFPSGTAFAPEFDNAELQSLWSTIGDNKPYSSSRSKASRIRSPVLRYFHKAIASTLYARQVTGNINDGEMQMMDLALQDVLDYTRDGRELLGNSANTGLAMTLVTQLFWYRDWALRLKRKGSPGEISVGGIVTPILVACGVDLLSEPYPPRWIDIEHLKRSSFLDISQPPGLFVYRFTHPTVGEASLRLPCTDLTSIRLGANIDFAPPLERLYTGIDEELMSEGDSGNSEDNDEDDDGSRRFGFAEYPVPSQSNPALKEAHKRIGLLQRWNKFQGKTIATLKESVRELKGQMKDLQQRFTGPPSTRKVILPKRILVRSGSLREAPSPHVPMEPPRASSFEPRQQLKQYTRRKKSEQASSSGQLDPPTSSHHLPTIYSTESTEQSGRAIPFPMFAPPESYQPLAESSSRVPYTRESMEDSVSSFFSNP